MNARYCPLHCTDGNAKAHQGQRAAQDYQAILNINFGKPLTNRGVWRAHKAYIQAYVSEMLKCHYLKAELSACICCCTTKCIIDVLMFSHWGYTWFA